MIAYIYVEYKKILLLHLLMQLSPEADPGFKLHSDRRDAFLFWTFSVAYVWLNATVNSFADASNFSK